MLLETNAIHKYTCISVFTHMNYKLYKKTYNIQDLGCYMWVQSTVHVPIRPTYITNLGSSSWKMEWTKPCYLLMCHYSLTSTFTTLSTHKGKHLPAVNISLSIGCMLTAKAKPLFLQHVPISCISMLKDGKILVKNSSKKLAQKNCIKQKCNLAI